jgi:hypothetical protein
MMYNSYFREFELLGENGMYLKGNDNRCRERVGPEFGTNFVEKIVCRDSGYVILICFGRNANSLDHCLLKNIQY